MNGDSVFDLNKVKPGQVVEIIIDGQLFHLYRPENAPAILPAYMAGSERTDHAFLMYTSLTDQRWVAPCRFVQVGKAWWDGLHAQFVRQIRDVNEMFFALTSP